jgi:phage major head subunit gpT-like protein
VNLTPELLKLVHDTFDNEVLQHVQKWPRFSMVRKSTTRASAWPWTELAPMLKEWLPSDELERLAESPQVLENEDYEIVHLDPLLDQMRVVSVVGRFIAEKAARWNDQLVAEAMIAGDKPAFGRGLMFQTNYDGHPFFSQRWAYSNALPGGANRPFVTNLHKNLPITGANLVMLVKEMEDRERAPGVKMGLIPSLLVVPPQLFQKVAAIGLDPEWERITPKHRPIEIVVMPELDAEPGAYYLLDTTHVDVQPFLLQKRMPLELAHVEMDSPLHAAKFKAQARGAAGYGPWFLATKAYEGDPDYATLSKRSR